MADAPSPIEKIMALDRAEFERSLHVLATGARLGADGRVVLGEGSGQVTLAFEALPSETLGGLLALPRARVALGFDGLSEDQATAFLTRFDRAFQRGGG